MEETLTTRKSLFHSVLSFINKIAPKRKVKEEGEYYSRFRLFLETIPKEDIMYDSVELAVALCDEAYRIVSQRLVLLRRITALEEQMIGLECFNNLDENETVLIKDLLARFSSLTREKSSLRQQLMSFDKSLERITKLEEEARNAIDPIKDAEKYHRILKQDLAYLEGEKDDLVNEMESLMAGADFVYKFSIGVVVVFCLGALYLGYMFMFTEAEIFFPTATLVLLAIVTATVLYLFRHRVSYELKMNIKKQQKAVRMLNKKNVVFAYYTNFLKFEYNKYKVRNSSMLQSNLDEYRNYLRTANRLDSIRSITYETEGLIEKFLREKNLNHSNLTLEQFAQTIDIDDKLAYYKELANQKESFEKNLADLDAKHEKIWAHLEELNLSDMSDEKVIDSILMMYFSEVNKLVESIDKMDYVV